MILFSLTHFLAVFVSAIFIIRLFGLRLMSMFGLWLKSILYGRYNLYVFWGINEISMTVAESLLKKKAFNLQKLVNDEEKVAVKKTLLVFVKIPDEVHHHSSRFTFGHFFHTVDDGIEEYMERIERLNSRNFSTYVAVSKRPIDMELAETCKERGIFSELRLKNLRRCFLKSAKVEFFFMSDDEQKNVSMVRAMKKSILLSAANGIQNIFTIYCYGRENRINKSILGNNDGNCNVYLVDSSMLAVLQLKSKGENQPINFVRYDDTTATVSSVFTAMIIGFGETGRDVLRFLYEFGSFIKETKAGEDGKDYVVEQDKKIYVADGHLTKLKTRFLVNAPALVHKDSIEWLEDMSTHDMRFWDKMRKIINTLNYIVIAVDNDKEAAFIAVQVFEFAHRYRKDLAMFKIYVRLRDDGNKRLLEQIRKYSYNINGKETKIIEAFGTKEEIFSYVELVKT